MNKVKKFLALSLALVMMLSVASFGAVIDFTDEAEIPEVNKEAVKLLSTLTILNGYEDGTFRPDGTITRAEAAKMIYVLCNNGKDDGGEIYKGQNLFVDVEAGSWYEGYVNYCANVNIIAGRGNGVFDPQATVTGYELMKMLLVVAEYKPEIQGYTGGSWAANVLRDAASSGMTKGYEFNMNTAAPRHWAARLFYNTIIDVQAAVYIGDTLFTNPAVLGDNFSQLVGYKKLGLQYATGTVTGTPTLQLNANGNKYGSFGNSVINYDGKEFATDYEIDYEYLGQQVRIIYRLKNSLLGNATTNWDIFGVYPTGVSVVSDTNLDDIVATPVFGTDYTSTTWKNAGYPNSQVDYFDVAIPGINNGKAVRYAISASGNRGMSSFSSTVLTNKYTRLWTATPSVITAYGYLMDSNVDEVRAIDSNGDGAVDYVFVMEGGYYNVSNVTASRVTFATNNGTPITTNLDKVEYDGELVLDDVVRVVPRYETGALVYEANTLEAEKLQATKWTYNAAGTLITSVTLDGTVRYQAGRSAINVLTADHTIYYLDEAGYIAYSKISADETTAPSNVAIITNISADVLTTQDAVASAQFYGYRVTYVTADGKSTTKAYDLTGAYAARASGALEGVEKIAATGVDAAANHAAVAQSRTNLEKYLNGSNAGHMLLATVTDDGVYFKVYSDSNKNSYVVDNGNTVLGNVSYSQSTGTLRFGYNSAYVADSSVIFAKYTNSTGAVKYTAIKGADLRYFSTNYGANVTDATTDRNAAIKAAYIDFGAKNLPSESEKKTYAVITGGASFQTISGAEYVLLPVATVGEDGQKVDTVLTISTGADFFTVDGLGVTAFTRNQIIAYVNSMKLRVIEYKTLTNGRHTATQLSGGNMGQITSGSSDYFVLDGSRYAIGENTQIFYFVDGAVYVSTSAMTTSTNRGAYAIIDTTSGNDVQQANVLVISGDALSATDMTDTVIKRHINPAAGAIVPPPSTGPVTGVTATTTTLAGQALVTWDAATTPATVVVQVSTEAGFPVDAAKTTNHSLTLTDNVDPGTYLVTGLNPGTYYFRVVVTYGVAGTDQVSNRTPGLYID